MHLSFAAEHQLSLNEGNENIMVLLKIKMKNAFLQEMHFAFINYKHIVVGRKSSLHLIFLFNAIFQYVSLNLFMSIKIINIWSDAILKYDAI